MPACRGPELAPRTRTGGPRSWLETQLLDASPRPWLGPGGPEAGFEKVAKWLLFSLQGPRLHRKGWGLVT